MSNLLYVVISDAIILTNQTLAYLHQIFALEFIPPKFWIFMMLACFLD